MFKIKQGHAVSERKKNLCFLCQMQVLAYDESMYICKQMHVWIYCSM